MTTTFDQVEAFHREPALQVPDHENRCIIAEDKLAAVFFGGNVVHHEWNYFATVLAFCNLELLLPRVQRHQLFESNFTLQRKCPRGGGKGDDVQSEAENGDGKAVHSVFSLRQSISKSEVLTRIKWSPVERLPEELLL
jgi:hypothetical protein